jgi:DNA-3-methyladenine glycosylase
MKPPKRLDYEFFNRSTLHVAQDLIGKVMVFGGHKGIITETEAYIGSNDPACHAARGRTPRTEVMFGPAGITYVYFIYGMYHCLNFVTEKEGFAAAVLIRGITLKTSPYLVLDGPGKLCRFLNITKHHNGLDLTKDDSFYIEDHQIFPSFLATPRIGISKGKEKFWRFVAQK